MIGVERRWRCGLVVWRCGGRCGCQRRGRWGGWLLRPSPGGWILWGCGLRRLLCGGGRGLRFWGGRRAVSAVVVIGGF